jgi:hypothetical protein
MLCPFCDRTSKGLGALGAHILDRHPEETARKMVPYLRTSKAREAGEQAADWLRRVIGLDPQRPSPVVAEILEEENHAEGSPGPDRN